MTAKQSIRYDFGRCTVKGVSKIFHRATTSPVTFMRFPESTEVSVRLTQADYDKDDGAQFLLSDYDARTLAEAILEALA